MRNYCTFCVLSCEYAIKAEPHCLLNDKKYRITWTVRSTLALGLRSNLESIPIGAPLHVPSLSDALISLRYGVVCLVGGELYQEQHRTITGKCCTAIVRKLSAQKSVCWESDEGQKGYHRTPLYVHGINEKST